MSRVSHLISSANKSNEYTSSTEQKRIGKEKEQAQEENSIHRKNALDNSQTMYDVSVLEIAACCCTSTKYISRRLTQID